MPRSVPHRRAAPPCWAAAVVVAACAGGAWRLAAAEVTEEDHRKVRAHIEKQASASAAKLRRPQQAVPHAHWGDMTDITGFKERDKEPWSKLSRLWEDRSLDNVLAAFREVPLPLSFEMSYILESRLIEGDNAIDYSIKLHTGDFGTYIQHKSVQAWASRSEQWKECTVFLESAQDGSYHQELWMEFDQATGPSAPSVFVAPLNWIGRTFLTRGQLAKLIGRVPSLDDAFVLWEDLLVKVWSPFWSSMPWLSSTQVQVRRRLAEVLWLANGKFSLYQLGFWLARDTGSVRVVLEEEHTKIQHWQNTTAWWAALREPLLTMGWRWADAERPGLLDDLMPKLLAGISHIQPAINIMAEGVIAKIGFEMYFDRDMIRGAVRKYGASRVDAESRPSASTFLSTLVECGLCAPERRAAALDFGLGAEDGVEVTLKVSKGLQYGASIVTNHIKVTFEPGKPVEAKLYTAGAYKWLRQKGRGRRRLPSAAEL